MVFFLYHGSFWIVFDCIETDFKDEMRGKHFKFFFLYNYKLVFSFVFWFLMYAVKSVSI